MTRKAIILFLIFTVCISCVSTAQTADTDEQEQPATMMPNGEFIYNLPCKVVNIHQELEGKSVLFLWLHGGVRDRKKHDLFGENHLDYCEADDMILRYLESHNIKAIALFPICHKAVNPECVAWKDCFAEVKHIIDDYVSKGLVDEKRIYLAGSSDGGTGTWDYAEMHPEVFASAIAMSCNNPRNVTIPIFFYNTRDEDDCSSQVAALQKKGSNILEYKYCGDVPHGGDAAQCTDDVLDRFFGFTK